MSATIEPISITGDAIIGIDIGKTGGAAIVRGRSVASSQWSMKTDSDTETALRIAAHLRAFIDSRALDPMRDIGIISILTPTVWRNIELFRAHTFVIGALSMLLRESFGPNCLFTYLADSQARKELGLPHNKEKAHRALWRSFKGSYDFSTAGRTPDERDAIIAALASRPNLLNATEAIDW